MSAADDQTATATAVSVLSDSSISAINFGGSGISVSSSMYAQVSKAITEKKITVVVLPSSLKSNVDGEYLPVLTLPGHEWYDVLVLRWPDLGTTRNDQIGRAATIVHECTHAGFDLLQVPDMTHVMHEAGAYVAEAMFVAAKMLSLGGDPSRVRPSEPIHAAALDIALHLNSGAAGVPVSYFVSLIEKWNKLYTAILNNNEYKAIANQPVINDGVGRPWK